jgi:hypothetical protein
LQTTRSNDIALKGGVIHVPKPYSEKATGDETPH